MAAVAGNQLQTAIFAGSCKHRLGNAVVADGLIQILVGLDLPIDGKWMIQKLMEICRVQAHGKALALLGNGQGLLRLFVRIIQPVGKNPCDLQAKTGGVGLFPRLLLWVNGGRSL